MIWASWVQPIYCDIYFVLLSAFDISQYMTSDISTKEFHHGLRRFADLQDDFVLMPGSPHSARPHSPNGSGSKLWSLLLSMQQCHCTSYSCMGAPFGKLLRRARASNSGNCSTSVSISPNWISTWTDTRAATKPIPCINRGRDNRLPPHDFVLYFLVFFIFVSC